MPRFEITGPDGHRYEVTAPEGATEAEVLERVKAEASTGPATPATPKITPADRAAYTEALPGTPEGQKTRAAIEQKYGGREAFLQAFDPTGEYLGKHVVPLVMASGVVGGVPGLATSMAEGGAAVLSAPALRTALGEVAKKVGKAAIGGGAAGGAFEVARRAFGRGGRE